MICPKLKQIECEKKKQESEKEGRTYFDMS